MLLSGMTAAAHEDLGTLRRVAEGAMLRERFDLLGRIDRLRREGEAADEALVERVVASAAEAGRRGRLVPAVAYPEELPVSQRREEIKALIAANQVVVLAGETGSGKTTQLPKICLELGRGVAGMIGHTQPRRLAARSVSERVAQELGVEPGREVGYKVRFTSEAGPDTLVKLMTDGILLAETQGDRHLNAYDTIIVDEAHERSLNIDFLLGYLHRLLPRRPDLKLVITSATIDVERFSKHFHDAPVIEVSGRTYPVDVRYATEDVVNAEDFDLPSAVVEQVRALGREAPTPSDADTLVFLAGEREIREVAEALRGANLRDTEVLPLFGRLAAAEQQRVFKPDGKRRRIVLATNVAETSLTVPGIRYVIDPGTARISRYSARSKVQRLPIEPISRASADQRAGRCGRVSSGVCVRLYTEEDYEGQRPRFTEPEVQRTNLASVILQMKALKLGSPEDFPFLDPPDYRQLQDGYQTLQELQALDDQKRLTELGRRLARLPIDPRLGRMVLAADGFAAVAEVLVVVAALSVQDPRERPMDKRQQADEKHAVFADKSSDFLGLLKLWGLYHAVRRERSGSQAKRWCREHFLSAQRMREWADVHTQLRQLARDLGLRGGEEAGAAGGSAPGAVAGAAGERRGPGREGDGEARVRRAAGQAVLAVPRQRAVRGLKPQWVMAAELVETTKLYARTAGPTKPEWVEAAADAFVAAELQRAALGRAAADGGALREGELAGADAGAAAAGAAGAAGAEAGAGVVHPPRAGRGAVRDRCRVHAAQRGARPGAGADAGQDAAAGHRGRAGGAGGFLRGAGAGGGRGRGELRSLAQVGRAGEWGAAGVLYMEKADLLLRSAEDLPLAMFPEEIEAGVTLPLRYRFDPGHAADGVSARVQTPRPAQDRRRPAGLAGAGADRGEVRRPDPHAAEEPAGSTASRPRSSRPTRSTTCATPRGRCCRRWRRRSGGRRGSTSRRRRSSPAS